ncbi:hypothetical protein ABVE29_002062 [Providencia stuartii]
MKLHYFFIFPLSFLLFACSPPENKIHTAIKKEIATHYPDPDSIQYKDIVVHRNADEAIVCGEFNAKNNQNEFMGFRPFISEVYIGDDIAINSVRVGNRIRKDSFPALVCEHGGYEGGIKAQNLQNKAFIDNMNGLAQIENYINDSSVGNRVRAHLINRAKEIYDNELSPETLKVVDSTEGRLVTVVAYKKGDDVYFASILNQKIYELEPIKNSVVKYIHGAEKDKNLVVLGNYTTEDNGEKPSKLLPLAIEILENGVSYANAVFPAKS